MAAHVLASPLLLALVIGLFTYAMTALGAAAVFLHRNPSARLLDIMLGFSAGVMLAASYFSLLAPSVAIAGEGGMPVWFAPVIGFLAGGLGLWGLDKLMPHIMPGSMVNEGITTGWRRSTLLVLAITLHHIPEGLAIGVAAGAAGLGVSHATVGAAVALGLGLGLQNLPEGLAVAMTIVREGASRKRAFTLGQFTGAVEPIAAVLGAALVVGVTALLPYALAFAAGAMVFVVIEELVPECQRSGHADAAVLAAIVGFSMMMVLDLMLA
jgi:ZIP family zinc transporter